MTVPSVTPCRGSTYAPGTTVADAMLRRPKVCEPSTTVGQARAMFADDHVHAVLVVADDVLLAVVERADLEGAPDHAPAGERGRLLGRVVGPDADLHETWHAMTGRRLAVVDTQGRLLGLLCLKRHGRGFCSLEDVAARERERRLAG
ncbi:CBS domain-containing protein [Actinomycetospora succinea]|uniref:CBS domain-containing protein n=1 Tax=Actinomycetospora succinea TaxID=663603 RepID=A0A4R6VE35_9PSEU|nr:CBS domain-containing protein [Actinomycetospora succinea]TDQ58680.1 CBS domain-containing protein [Actinomycetospora succinea]